METARGAACRGADAASAGAGSGADAGASAGCATTLLNATRMPLQTCHRSLKV